jgi:aminoglycoside phosphotransferase (APT) family kinase protein
MTFSLAAFLVDLARRGYTTAGIPMQAPKLHAGEIDISAGLAARLIAEQFPHWARLPVRPVSSAGTECVLYRLGDDLVIRLPRRPGESLDAVLSQGVLARLAPFLPVPVPALIAEGRPTAGYPTSWGVLRWLDGDTPVEGHLAEPVLLAADLAGFLRALWKVDLSEAARLPPWDGPETWIHADMMPGNVVIRNGRLAGVIDFGAAGPGDPSQDLIVAWMLLPASVRPAFRRATGADDATWLRGRARALSMALGHLGYYSDTNPVMADNARYTISEVLADYRGMGD